MTNRRYPHRDFATPRMPRFYTDSKAVIAVALILSALGVTALYIAWRSGNALSGWTGALLCGLTAWPLAVVYGLEFAVLYALALPALLVWPLIGREAVILAPKPLEPLPRSGLSPKARNILTHTGHALLILIVLLVLTAPATVLVSRTLPLGGAAQGLAGILLMPILWASLAYLYLISRHKALFAAGAIVLSIALTSWIFL